MTTAAYLSREPYHTWRKDGFAQILVQTGKKRDTQFANVPTIYELMNEHKTPQKDRELLTHDPRDDRLWPAHYPPARGTGG